MIKSIPSTRWLPAVRQLCRRHRLATMDPEFCICTALPCFPTLMRVPLTVVCHLLSLPRYWRVARWKACPGSGCGVYVVVTSMLTIHRALPLSSISSTQSNINQQRHKHGVSSSNSRRGHILANLTCTGLQKLNSTFCISFLLPAWVNTALREVMREDG